LLWRVRKDLRLLGNHDWAALVVYATSMDEVPSELAGAALSLPAEFVAEETERLQKLVTSRRMEIHSSASLSFISWATRKASCIVSVDFELDSWAYIVNEAELARAQTAVGEKARPGRKVPGRERLDDFENIYQAMEKRLDGRDKQAPLSDMSPAIIRTFALHAAGPPELTTTQWAILNRLKLLEDKTRNADGRLRMQNKVLFLDDPELDTSVREQVRNNGDVILFYREREAPQTDDWPPDEVPEELDGYGIRERQIKMGDDVRVESEVIEAGEPMKAAYSRAMLAWKRAIPIEPAAFLQAMKAQRKNAPKRGVRRRAKARTSRPGPHPPRKR
jgi:hypothetical protein